MVLLKGDQDTGARPLKWQDSVTSSGNTAQLNYSVGTNGNDVNGFKVFMTYTLTSIAANKAMVKIDFSIKNVLTSTRTVDFFPYCELNALDATGNGGGAQSITYNPLTREFKQTTASGAFDMYFWSQTPVVQYTAAPWLGLRPAFFGSTVATLNNTVPGTIDDYATAFRYTYTLAPQETSSVGTIYVGYNHSLNSVRTVSGHVNPAGGRTLTSIELQFRNSGTLTNVGAPVTATVDGSGNYTVNAPGNANYDITVNPSGFLRRTINANATSGNVTNANLNLFPGDIVDDVVIDLSDYTKLVTYFNKTSGDADWNTPDSDGIRPSDADLDANGVIDLSDYTLVIINFNATADN